MIDFIDYLSKEQNNLKLHVTLSEDSKKLLQLLTKYNDLYNQKMELLHETVDQYQKIQVIISRQKQIIVEILKMEDIDKALFQIILNSISANVKNPQNGPITPESALNSKTATALSQEYMMSSDIRKNLDALNTGLNDQTACQNIVELKRITLENPKEISALKEIMQLADRYMHAIINNSPNIAVENKVLQMRLRLLKDLDSYLANVSHSLRKEKNKDSKDILEILRNFFLNAINVGMTIYIKSNVEPKDVFNLLQTANRDIGDSTKEELESIQTNNQFYAWLMIQKNYKKILPVLQYFNIYDPENSAVLKRLLEEPLYTMLTNPYTTELFKIAKKYNIEIKPDKMPEFLKYVPQKPSIFDEIFKSDAITLYSEIIDKQISLGFHFSFVNLIQISMMINTAWRSELKDFTRAIVLKHISDNQSDESIVLQYTELFVELNKNKKNISPIFFFSNNRDKLSGIDFDDYKKLIKANISMIDSSDKYSFLISCCIEMRFPAIITSELIKVYEIEDDHPQEKPIRLVNSCNYLKDELDVLSKLLKNFRIQTESDLNVFDYMCKSMSMRYSGLGKFIPESGFSLAEWTALKNLMIRMEGTRMDILGFALKYPELLKHDLSKEVSNLSLISALAVYCRGITGNDDSQKKFEEGMHKLLSAEHFAKLLTFNDVMAFLENAFGRQVFSTTAYPHSMCNDPDSFYDITKNFVDNYSIKDASTVGRYFKNTLLVNQIMEMDEKIADLIKKALKEYQSFAELEADIKVLTDNIENIHQVKMLLKFPVIAALKKRSEKSTNSELQYFDRIIDDFKALSPLGTLDKFEGKDYYSYDSIIKNFSNLSNPKKSPPKTQPNPKPKSAGGYKGFISGGMNYILSNYSTIGDYSKKIYNKDYLYDVDTYKSKKIISADGSPTTEELRQESINSRMDRISLGPYTLKDLAEFYKNSNSEMAFIEGILDKNIVASFYDQSSKIGEEPKLKDNGNILALRFAKSYIKVMGRFAKYIEQVKFTYFGAVISRTCKLVLSNPTNDSDNILRNATQIIETIANDSSIDSFFYITLCEPEDLYILFKYPDIEGTLKFIRAYDKIPSTKLRIEDLLKPEIIEFADAVVNAFKKIQKKDIGTRNYEICGSNTSVLRLNRAIKLLKNPSIIKFIENLETESSEILCRLMLNLTNYSFYANDVESFIDAVSRNSKVDAEIISTILNIKYMYNVVDDIYCAKFIEAAFDICTSMPNYTKQINIFLSEAISQRATEGVFYDSKKFLDFLRNIDVLKELGVELEKSTFFKSEIIRWSMIIDDTFSKSGQLAKILGQYVSPSSSLEVGWNQKMSDRAYLLLHREVFEDIIIPYARTRSKYSNHFPSMEPKTFLEVISNKPIIEGCIWIYCGHRETAHFIECLENRYNLFTNLQLSDTAKILLKEVKEFISSLSELHIEKKNELLIELCHIIMSKKFSLEEFISLFDKENLNKLKNNFDVNFKIDNMQELVSAIILLPIYPEKKFLKKIISTYLALRKSRMDTENLKGTFDSIAKKIIEVLSSLKTTSSENKYLLKETYNLIIIGNESKAAIPSPIMSAMSIGSSYDIITRIRQYAINLDQRQAIHTQFWEFRQKIHNNPGIEDINLTAALKKFWEDGQIEFLEAVWNETIKYGEIEKAQPKFAELKKFRENLSNISNVKKFFSVRELRDIIKKFGEPNALDTYPYVYINTVLLLEELEKYYSVSADLNINQITQMIEENTQKAQTLSKEFTIKNKEFFKKYQQFLKNRQSGDALAAANNLSLLRTYLNRDWTSDERVKMAIDNILKNLEQKVYSDVSGSYALRDENGQKISLSLNDVTNEDTFKNYLLFVEDLLQSVIASGLDGYPINLQDDDISKEFSLEKTGPNVNYFSMAKINLMTFRIKKVDDTGKILEAMRFIDSGIELFSRIVLSDIKRLVDDKLKENQISRTIDQKNIEESRNIEVERLMSRFYKIGAIYNLGQAAGEVTRFLTGGKGIMVYEGQAWGICRIVNNANDAKNFLPGSIFISKNPTPELSAAMMSASAIITEEGGSTSHAAMIAREHKKPCIVGRYKAMSDFKNGEYLFVDTKDGEIEKISKEEAEKHKNIELLAEVSNNPKNPLIISNVMTKEDIKNYFNEYKGMNKYTPFIVPLTKATDVTITGGKAANLAILKSLENNSPFRAPDGFVVTTLAYVLTILKNYEKISNKNLNSMTEKEIEDIFISLELPKIVENQIAEAYSKIDKGMRKLVAVRSSATVEDTGESTFAGLHESFLFRSGLDTIIRDIKKCWASMYSERAKKHRAILGVDEKEAKMSVVVQRMIDADYSGVIYTTLTEDLEYFKPDINKNISTKEIIKRSDALMKFEIIKGQGEELVSGKKTPTLYIVNKMDGGVIKIQGTENNTINIMMQELAASAMIVEHAYSISSSKFRPQDIEFCIKNGEIFLLQTRDIAIANKEKNQRKAA